MGHRYGGAADGSYLYLVHMIKKNDRLSQKKKDELLEGVDLLVGHMIEDFDSSLRDQYSSYYCFGSRWLKHMYTDSRDMLLEVALKALETCSWARKRFDKAGFISRI